MDPSISESCLESYNISFDNEKIKMFIIDYLISLANFKYTGDLEVLEGTQTDGDANGLNSIFEQVSQFAETKAEEFMSNPEMLESFKKLIDAFMYFGHKSMRTYYFGSTAFMMTKLFQDFDEESTFSSLVENLRNLDDEDTYDIVEGDKFTNFYYDLLFDDLSILDLPVMTKESVKLRKYKEFRQGNVITAYINLLTKVDFSVNNFVKSLSSPHSPLEEFNVSNEIIIHLMNLFYKSTKDVIYKFYADRFETGFNNLEDLNEFGIENIYDAGNKQLNLLRKGFTIIGYVRMNPADNPFEFEYVDAEFFLQDIRRMLLI
jgi:hypothetical protein